MNLFEMQTICEREAKEAETEEKKKQWLNALNSVEDHLPYFEETKESSDDLNECMKGIQDEAIPINWIKYYFDLMKRTNNDYDETNVFDMMREFKLFRIYMKAKGFEK